MKTRDSCSEIAMNSPPETRFRERFHVNFRERFFEGI